MVTQEEYDAIKRERDELHHLLHFAGTIEIAVRNPNVNSFMTEWEARTEKAEAERDEAVKALEPFAEAADDYFPPEYDDNDMAWGHDFPIGLLRAARQIVAKHQEANHDA